MPACLGGDEPLLCVQIQPDMLQLVQVLDVPIPPDRVLNGTGSVRRQADLTRERRRRAVATENGIADDQWDKWLAGVKPDAWRVMYCQSTIRLCWARPVKCSEMRFGCWIGDQFHSRERSVSASKNWAAAVLKRRLTAWPGLIRRSGCVS